MGKESTLDKDVIKLVKARGGMAKKMHGSVFMSGIPDILIGYKGRLIFLEDKASHGRLRPGQRLTLIEAREAGCIGEVCYGIELVKDILNTIDGGFAWVHRSTL